MIDKQSGKIVHIDFGDCWEVCQIRSKFPENVPFRMTRMMVKAMEVTGLNGSFKSDAENVIRCLRENKDSLTAMLEAFVHDPLISWRLLAEAEAGGGKESNNSGAGERVERDVKGNVGEEEGDEESKKSSSSISFGS